MSAFNVLDPATDIYRNYLIEASAGTGKTFSIENIVLRLLSSGYCTIDQMLIVTFTRAATRDLRVRIRENITAAREKNISDRFLHQALLMFDRASIETIHGFCSRTLREYLFESNVSMDVISDHEQLSNTLLQQMIFDFFRTELDPKRYSPAQVKRVRMDLEKRLLRAVKRGVTVADTDDFSALFARFQQTVKTLSCSTERVISEFETLYPSFLKYKDAEEKVERFAKIIEKEKVIENDFDQLIEDDLAFVHALSPERVRKKVKEVPQSFLYEEFRNKLLPIISEARDPIFIVGRMVRDCLELVETYLESEELMRFDDLLKCMDQATQNPLFSERIRKKYRVIIVDEFQDTDPIQWRIFKKLAENWDGLLYLVGDPKQSIYAFRNADIYTYLDAADFLGEEARASLLTNYRSSAPLVHALNAFFSVPHLIPLPRTDSHLTYPIVQASEQAQTKEFGDDLGAIHFSIAPYEESRWSVETVEQQLILPFIVNEIQRIQSDIAILVRTRYQGKRVAEFLKKCGIPIAMQQNEALSETDAFHAFRELIMGIVHPRDDSYLKTMLGGVLIGWSDCDILKLEDESLREDVLSHCYALRTLLFDQGFAPFVHHLLATVWPGSDAPLSASILNRTDGLFVYEDLMHLIQLVLRRESEGPLTPEGVLAFLEEIKILEFEEDSNIRRVSDADGDAVQIMTMHASKGLEFGVVFALGLIERTPEPERLVPNVEKQQLEAVSDTDDPRYQLFCQELDAEKMRQLYVTMTRAKQRLYVPIIEALKVKPPKRGMSSPIELYLEKLPETIEAFVGKHPDEQMTCSVLKPAEVRPVEQKQNKAISPPKTITIPGSDRYIQSFSSLYSSSPDTTLSPPHDFVTADKTIHTLPAGSETGIVLHCLLEKILFKHYESAKEIEPLLLLESKFEEWRSVLAQNVYDALHAPLDGFCLADVDPNNVYREIEFLYPTQEGFMKGIIDLAFSYQGRYYLLDWKSNWLGPDDEAYSQDNLTAVMGHHHYDVQASIYSEAFKRYLNIVDSNTFRGVFYVFLRGMGILFVESTCAASKKAE